MRGTSQMAVFQQLAKVFSMDCVRHEKKGGGHSSCDRLNQRRTLSRIMGKEESNMPKGGFDAKWEGDKNL